MKVAVCKKPGKPLVIEERPKPEIKEGEVLIKVEACGVCHSDVHIVDGDWAEMVTYPVIPGHEVVGTIEAIQEPSYNLKVGMRVGMPWIYDTCGVCQYCLEGEDDLCPDQKVTGITHPGGYAEYMVAPARYATVVPEELDPIEAAPLFCAGLTVYSAIKRMHLPPGSRLGVQGIGGLGHMAVQYGHALGYEVVAITRSMKKTEAIRALGAKEIISTDNPDNLKAYAQTLDGILTTVFDTSLMELVLPLLKPRGVFSIVGAGSQPLKISPLDLITRRIMVTGSAVGGRKLLREALAFSAKHQLLPKVETYPLEKVNEALAKVREGKANLRVVLR